jgi:hypothetical protein
MQLCCISGHSVSIVNYCFLMPAEYAARTFLPYK